MSKKKKQKRKSQGVLRTGNFEPILELILERFFDKNVFSTPSTPRRSSRIRQRSGSQSESGQSDAESEDGSKGNIEKPSQKVDPLPALEEDKEIVFSPPRSKQSSKSIPVSAENLQSSEPKFS